MFGIEHNEYRKYNYGPDTPLITRDNQIYEYLERKFSEVDGCDDMKLEHIKTDIHRLDHHLHHIDAHIEKAKTEIIDNGAYCGSSSCGIVDALTKEDLNEAVSEIKQHTSGCFDKLNFDDFRREFTDLNDDVKKIKNKLWE